MTRQLALWAGPAARRTDPATSHAAAQAQTSRLEDRILTLLAAPLTDDEVCDRLPELYAPSVKTARSRLARRGLVVPAGERVSHRGRRMTVWVQS